MTTDAHFKSKFWKTYAVILVGDCRVGKTSYLNYIVNNRATNKGQNQPPTIGV
jgi:GTPase SAR1 family protein